MACLNDIWMIFIEVCCELLEDSHFSIGFMDEFLISSGPLFQIKYNFLNFL
jgi:hypothetical protein